MPIMSSNERLVQYIEQEAFKGRHVSEIITDVKSAGWTDDQIQKAVNTLNQEHDILQELDLDPIHKKKPLDLRLLWIGFVAALTTLVLVLGVALVVQAVSKPDLLGFSDPNFTMVLPDDWNGDAAYKPGTAVVFFYSSEDREPENAEKTARMTLYVDSDQDAAGSQLLDGGSTARVITDETGVSGSVRYRYIEYVNDSFVNENERIRGAYIYVDRGRITMSARITSNEKHWDLHKDEAEKILKSVTPNCSREALSAEYNDDGTIFLCGRSQ